MTPTSRLRSSRSSSRKRLLACAPWLLAAAVACAGSPEARSPDGAWRLEAEGSHLTLFDAAGRPAKRYTAATLDGSRFSSVSGIVHAAPRRSFIVSFETLPELWEVSLNPDAEPIFNGYVHDYKMGEGIAEPGFLGVRRTPLELPLGALAFDRSHAFVLGRAPDAPDGRAVLHLVQLDIRRRIARFTVDGAPDLAAAHAESRDARELIVVPRRGAEPLRVDVRAARLLEPAGAAEPRR